MRFVQSMVVGLMMAGCGTWPSTRMEPVADYGSQHVTVSSTPAYTAGPDYMNTTSPDGATLFVCTDLSTEPGNRVPPHTEPAC